MSVTADERRSPDTGTPVTAVPARTPTGTRHTEFGAFGTVQPVNGRFGGGQVSNENSHNIR